MTKNKISTDAWQAAYNQGRNDERCRWARNLRRWVKKDKDDHTVVPCIWVDDILEKIKELAKKEK